jgi:DNA-binding LacI/PurR family transcriptional regulator
MSDAERAGATPRPAPRRRAASTDVANLAGVSQKTVSRVINDEPYVKEEVRLRVLQAAQQLGYRRNNAARALNSGRTRRIGLVSLGSTLHGPASMLFEMERAARSTGYSLSVVTTFEGDPAGVAGAIDSLLAEGVDGIVLSEPIDEGENVRIDVDIPVLSLGRFPGLTGPRVVITGVDGSAAGRVATEHLLSLGHRTVWHVAGPQRWWSARDRLDGWREALQHAGAAEPPWIEGDWSPASGYAAGERLARNPEVTAVFVANDDMAIGVLRAFAEAGRPVPQDVSVVGLDDIPTAAFHTPPLTTVRQDFAAQARQGLERLVQQIEAAADEPPGIAQPPICLIVRRSTAPVPERPRSDQAVN